MATIAGLVSGGAGLISLSLQLMETAIKLKALVKAYKHVPQTMENLAFEIETFGLVVHEIERDRHAHDSPASDLLARCILLCQQSVERICTATARLEKMIGRVRFLGRLMTALEEKETLQIFQELERAKSTLSLAHHMYLESKRRHDSRTSLATSTDIRGILVQQQAAIESQCRDIQELRDGLVILTATVSTKLSDRSTHNEVATANRAQAIMSPTSVTSRPNRSIRSSITQKPRILKVDAWFLSRIWRLSIDRAPAGWDVKLRTWNVVPLDAPVFHMVTRGDLLGIRQLIEDGKASYYDVLPNEKTLLECAILCEQVVLTQHLLESTESWAVMQGVQGYERDNMASSDGVQIHSLLFGDPRLNLSDLLVDECGHVSPKWLVDSTTENLAIILSNLSEPWESRPLAQRFEIAMRLELSCACSTFRLALGPCSLEDIVDLRVDGWTTSAFQFAARAYLVQLDRDWGDLIVQLIQVGCHPYGKDDSGRTPFHYALDFHNTPRAKLRALEAWLKVVCEASVSSEASGRMVEEELATSVVTTVGIREDQDLVIEQLLPSPKSSDWDLIGYFQRPVSIWFPLKMPGQLEEYSAIRSVSLWEPSRDDECVLSKDLLTLGIWTKDFMKILSAPVSLRSLAQRDDDLNYGARFEMYGRCKDDADLNYLSREHGRLKTRQRSRSQPPDLKSSIELDIQDECCCDRGHFSFGIRWHKCRLDSRWRLHERHWFESQDDRTCMAGCVFDVDGLRNDIFDFLQLLARRREAGVKDYWDGDRVAEDDYIRMKNVSWSGG